MVGVHAAGSPSWEVSEQTSREVLVALYVRDALGIVDASGLPRLLGTGLAEVAPPDDLTGWRWTRWWISIVEPDAALPAVPGDDDGFRAILRRHIDDARTWAEVARSQSDERAAARAHGRADLIGDLVAEASRGLDRGIHPFRLRIELVPLVTPGVWWIGEDVLVVDDQLRDDPLLLPPALGPILRQLA